MAHQPAAGGPFGPMAISLIRTEVPVAWGYTVSRLVDLGIPPAWLAGWHDTFVTGLTGVATFAWYAAWRWAETRLPKLDSWAARLVVMLALGHPSQPSYSTPKAAIGAQPPGGV